MTIEDENGISINTEDIVDIIVLHFHFKEDNYNSYDISVRMNTGKIHHLKVFYDYDKAMKYKKKLYEK